MLYSWAIRNKAFTIIYEMRKFAHQARIIDGKEIAKGLRKTLKVDILNWVEGGYRPPNLTAIIVGDEPASHAYVNIKLKTAKRLGINANVKVLNCDTVESDLLNEIHYLNQDCDVDGILVQLPLPSHINERRICNAVSPMKDVDGFSVYNIGRLALNMEAIVPCTALAVVEIIKSTGLDVKGKNALICGRSKNVGLPISLMLHSQQMCDQGSLAGLNMTTTLCHRHTPPEELAKLGHIADVIVSAAGVPKLITANMVKEGACIIDVGMTRIDGKDGKAMFVGDVDFDGVKEVAGWLTPVPGGVGPITVAMLLRNTFYAARNNSKFCRTQMFQKIVK